MNFPQNNNKQSNKKITKPSEYNKISMLHRRELFTVIETKLKVLLIINKSLFSKLIKYDCIYFNVECLIFASMENNRFIKQSNVTI